MSLDNSMEYGAGQRQALLSHWRPTLLNLWRGVCDGCTAACVMDACVHQTGRGWSEVWLRRKCWRGSLRFSDVRGNGGQAKWNAKRTALDTDAASASGGI